jgi:hypothetical protein
MKHLVVVGAFTVAIVLAGCSSPGTSDSGPTNQSGAATSETPAPEATPTSQLGSIEAGLPIEKLGPAVNEQFSAIDMAGTTEIKALWLAEAQKTGDGSDSARNAFETKMATEQVTTWATRMFGPDYATNNNFQTYVNNEIPALVSSYEFTMATTGDTATARGIDAYTHTSTFEKVRAISSSGDERTYEIDFIEQENLELVIAEGAKITLVGPVDPSKLSNGLKQTITITSHTSGTHEVISSFSTRLQ